MTTLHAAPTPPVSPSRTVPLAADQPAVAHPPKTGLVRVRSGLLWAGAALLPLGLLVILLGWYGIANTPYQYDQMSYLVSGGLLGLALTVTGGFLLFGSWLSALAEENRHTSERLTEVLQALVAVGTTDIPEQGRLPESAPVRLVTAGKGSTLHRSDCPLVGSRPDLVPFEEDVSTSTACRVCRPLDEHSLR